MIKEFNINWRLCKDYNDAKDSTGVIYLHQWNDAPVYWGKAHRSLFGGSPRVHNGAKKHPRYNSGYKHWIDSALKHGSMLYVGILTADGIDNINVIENFLIRNYPTEFNKKILSLSETIAIEHMGEVPTFLRKAS